MRFLHTVSSESLYSVVKAPEYATIPAATRQSPINRFFFSPRILTVSFHQPSSPARPEIIFSALDSFFQQSSIS
jgi:hypothetical protein